MRQGCTGLEPRGRVQLVTVRSGWDNDPTTDRKIPLFDPRREGLRPTDDYLPTDAYDGKVTPEERAHAHYVPRVADLMRTAHRNDARRLSDLLQGKSPDARAVLATELQQIRDHLHVQIRMSPEALTGFLTEGHFRTYKEVAVHHDHEPVTTEYAERRQLKEATTGLKDVIYASLSWNAVSRDATSPYGGVVLVLRNDRIFSRLTATERETFAYTTDREGFRSDVVTWDEVADLAAHFVATDQGPPGNFERTGSAPHLEVQISGEVSPEDVDAILLPRGTEWDEIATHVAELVKARGIAANVLEVLRYDPVVPEGFDLSEWKPKTATPPTAHDPTTATARDLHLSQLRGTRPR